MSDAVYTPDGDLLVPGDLVRGPWDRNSQHGGGPAAVLGRAIERASSDDGLIVVRITIEILRPVPLAPLRTAVTQVRGGKRVQLVEATLLHDDTPLARAHAWRMRAGGAIVPAVEHDRVPDGPDAGRHHRPPGDPGGFVSAVEWRFVEGGFEERGPATGWCRLKVPIVAGEEPSPLQRTLAAADFGNGMSAELDFGEYLFVNVDLTVYLNRYPAGEWIGLHAETDLNAAGIGMVGGRLYDTQGGIGRTAQSLFVEPRT